MIPAMIVQGDARHLPMDDDTVDLIVTSPPYWALRSYQDGGEHYDGQIGDEPTPAAFVDSLIEVTRECMRVLKPTGSLWVNLGDKYAERSGPDRPAADQDDTRYRKAIRPKRRTGGMQPKSLMMIPQRYAIRCVDELGLILRAEVIWSKPNGLPESVTDRVRRAHEQWFHFTLQPRYFSAVDEVREPHTWVPSAGYKGHAPRMVDGQPVHQFKSVHPQRGTAPDDDRDGTAGVIGFNPLGKLPGSVWEVPTDPLAVPDHVAHARCCGGRPRSGCQDGIDHHAAFPIEWPRRIIQGWAPTAGVCTECGQGRRPQRGTTCDECGEFRPNNAKECPGCGHRRAWKEGRVASASLGATDWSTAGHATPRHPGGHTNRSVVATDWSCACNEAIATPTGGPGEPDPSEVTGRAGFNRPRGDGDGPRVITRWEQRHEADQLRASPHRADMATEAGAQAFAHYIRTDRAGARPVPEALRRLWQDRGWLLPAPPFEPPPTTPAVVLDPFGGTGTTATAAKALGCVGVSVDLSADYCRIATWRTNDLDQLAKVRGIRRSEKARVLDRAGMMPLF
jgi:DNA modification methylase